MQKTVRILGTHGVPAAYGGFETAAENVARFLVDNGWRVVVYCQVGGDGPVQEDVWEGIERVSIAVDSDGWIGTSKFDFLSIKHALKYDDICLTFGYNTAIFNIAQRFKKIPNVINMDGIEWSRKRWGLFKQAILYVNERVGLIVGTHLIADHPEIEKYLARKTPRDKITTITYGADSVEDADPSLLEEYDLAPNEYMTIVARPIPENSILEIVTAFSRKRRGQKLVLLGNYSAQDLYHKKVLDAASPEVVFLGAIYEPKRVQTLRFFSTAYLHGHTVGGTNPSLVEALAAGNPVIAHDNPYNTWVAGDAGLYFSGIDTLDILIDRLIHEDGLARRLGLLARERHKSEFTWEHVAGQYEELLLKYMSKVVVPVRKRGSRDD